MVFFFFFLFGKNGEMVLSLVSHKKWNPQRDVLLGLLATDEPQYMWSTVQK